ISGVSLAGLSFRAVIRVSSPAPAPAGLPRLVASGRRLAAVLVGPRIAWSPAGEYSSLYRRAPERYRWSRYGAAEWLSTPQHGWETLGPTENSFPGPSGTRHGHRYASWLRGRERRGAAHCGLRGAAGRVEERYPAGVHRRSFRPRGTGRPRALRR